MKPLLKIAFTDFWEGFNPLNNAFHQILGYRWRLELSATPDLVVHAGFGMDYRRHRCHRLHFCGEPWYPKFQDSDLCFSPHRVNHRRHHRLPLWAVYAMGAPEQLLKPHQAPLPSSRPNFASILIGHTQSRRRISFFEQLNARRPVCSAGRALNNMGGPIPPGTTAKQEFLQSCQFNISFENTPIPGYVTEKIMEPLAVGCIPIYWGAPDIANDFNPECFIDVASFSSDHACIEHLLKIAACADRLNAMSRAPRLAGGRWPDAFTPAHLSSMVEHCLQEAPVAEARGSVTSTWSQVSHQTRAWVHALRIRRANRAAAN